MSTYTAGLTPTPPAFADGFMHPRAPFTPSVGGAPVVTYYYRTSGGARGSTTDAGSIPAGAVVERVA